MLLILNKIYLTVSFVAVFIIIFNDSQPTTISSLSYWQSLFWHKLTSAEIYGKTICLNNTSQYVSVEVYDSYTPSEVNYIQLCGEDGSKTQNYFPFLVFQIESESFINWTEVCSSAADITLIMKRIDSLTTSNGITKRPCNNYATMQSWNQGSKVVFFNLANQYGIRPVAQDFANAVVWMFDDFTGNRSQWYVIVNNASSPLISELFNVMQKMNWTLFCSASSLKHNIQLSLIDLRNSAYNFSQNCSNPFELTTSAPATLSTTSTNIPNQLPKIKSSECFWQDRFWKEIHNFSLLCSTDNITLSRGYPLWIDLRAKYCSTNTRFIVPCDATNRQLNAAELVQEIKAYLLKANLTSWCSFDVDIEIIITSVSTSDSVNVTNCPATQLWYHELKVLLLLSAKAFGVVAEKMNAFTNTTIQFEDMQLNRSAVITVFHPSNVTNMHTLSYLNNMNWTVACQVSQLYSSVIINIIWSNSLLNTQQNCKNPHVLTSISSSTKSPIWSTSTSPEKDGGIAAWQILFWSRFFNFTTKICETSSLQDGLFSIEIKDKFSKPNMKWLTYCTFSERTLLINESISLLLAQSLLNWTLICENAYEVQIKVNMMNGSYQQFSRCLKNEFSNTLRWFQGAWSQMLNELQKFQLLPISQFTITSNLPANTMKLKFSCAKTIDVEEQSSSVTKLIYRESSLQLYDVFFALQTVNWSCVCQESGVSGLLDIEISSTTSSQTPNIILTNQNCSAVHSLIVLVQPTMSPKFDSTSQNRKEMIINLASITISNNALNVAFYCVIVSFGMIIIFGVFWLMKPPTQAWCM